MKIVLILLILVLLLSAWLFPSTISGLAWVVFLLSLALAIFAIVKKHRTAYTQGRITRAVFARHIFLDVLGVLLAVALAVLLAGWVAGLLIGPISDELARQIAGILIGLLVGIGMGVLVNRLWGRFVKTSPQN